MESSTTLQYLIQQHFGSATLSPEVADFVRDVERIFGHAGIAGQMDVHISQPVQRAPAPIEGDLYLTVKNLQNLVIKLRRDEDGRIVYVLREGKLAGDYTTEIVRNRTPLELFGSEVAKVTMPNVERAFSGEVVQFEYELEGSHFLTLLEPVWENGSVSEVVGSMLDISKQKEIELQLRESETLFRTLIECMPVGILKQEVYGDGKVYDEVTNQEFRRITGYTLDEMWAMSTEERAELIHPDDRNDTLVQWQEWASTDGESVLHLQYRFKHRAGVYRWLDNFLVKIASGENEIILQAVIDITERTHNQQQLQHLASYLQQSIEPVFEMNADGYILFMNPAAEDSFPDLYELRLSHPITANFGDVMKQLASQEEAVLKRIVPVGSEYYQQHIYSMEESGVYRFFCHNITALKLAEQELREALEKERAVNMMRSHFISTISHEFRTPLTGINTAAALLQRYNQTMSPEQRTEQVLNIAKRVSELVDIIDNFTAQTSLRNLRDQFSPITMNIVSLCKQVTEEVRSRATDKKQSIECSAVSEELFVYGDEKLLRHALRNVIFNAVQYSPRESMIVITIQSDEHAVHISVDDQGIGIPIRDIEHLGTPFFRGSNVGNEQGSGLGLSIAKEFVELHHGDIGIVSKPGEGTCAVIHLPRSITTLH